MAMASRAVAILLHLLAGCCSAVVSTITSIVDNVISEQPAGVKILLQGAVHEDFDRPLPLSVEATLYQRFEGYVNDTHVRAMGHRPPSKSHHLNESPLAVQDFSASGENIYIAEGQQVTW